MLTGKHVYNLGVPSGFKNITFTGISEISGIALAMIRRASTYSVTYGLKTSATLFGIELFGGTVQKVIL